MISLGRENIDSRDDFRTFTPRPVQPVARDYPEPLIETQEIPTVVTPLPTDDYRDPEIYDPGDPELIETDPVEAGALQTGQNVARYVMIGFAAYIAWDALIKPMLGKSR